jgi:dTDP-4-amino-4,6-dideoxygalactose transaminase
MGKQVLVGPIPVNRPRLPRAEKIMSYLREIDRSRVYTNFGPLHSQLQTRLAEHHGVEARNLALAGSGTSALMALIMAVIPSQPADQRLCLCPSYTFVGTGAAARLCGLEPFLLDVDPNSWALDPDELEKCQELERVALVLVVAPYGRPPDLQRWERFTQCTRIPVIVDGAACFDAINASEIVLGTIPVSVSLHATKTFSTGEGGMLLGADPALIARATRALNFGFYDDRRSVGPCFNGKLSEYHAAVGLAELDDWEAKRGCFLAAAQEYAAQGERMGLEQFLHVSVDYASPYACFLAPDRERASKVVAALSRADIGWRRWYEGGLHQQPCFRDCSASTMTMTDELAQRLIGLPMFPDLSSQAIASIMEVIQSSLI